jgi:hypothetical protein
MFSRPHAATPLPPPPQILINLAQIALRKTHSMSACRMNMCYKFATKGEVNLHFGYAWHNSALIDLWLVVFPSKCACLGIQSFESALKLKELVFASSPSKNQSQGLPLFNQRQLHYWSLHMFHQRQTQVWQRLIQAIKDSCKCLQGLCNFVLGSCVFVSRFIYIQVH